MSAGIPPIPETIDDRIARMDGAARALLADLEAIGADIAATTPEGGSADASLDD